MSAWNRRQAASAGRRRQPALLAGTVVLVVAAVAFLPTAGAAAARPSRAPALATPTGAPPPNPAALPALPANATYGRQILQSLDPERAEPARPEVVRVGNLLDFGLTGPVVVAGELRRPAALDPLLRELFTRYLERPADPSGLAFWRRQVQGGRSLESFAAHLATSAEARRHAGAGDAAYVDWAYQHVLDRAADPNGRDYWVRRLGAGTTKLVFVGSLLRSNERATRLVPGAYERFLRRVADSAGRAALVRAYAERRVGELDVIAQLLGSGEARRSGCDPFDTRACLLPFPNDLATVADATTATGRRVAFKPEWMPRNASGRPMRPTEWNRNDGFSAGQAALLRVPGLDLAGTGAAPLSDIGASLDADAPIVVVDAATGEHHPVFTELDAKVPDADAARDRLLYIRPARNYVAGHRYVVALRRLKDAAGNPIEAPASFRQYRDGAPGSGSPAVEDRRPHMDQVLGELAAADVARDDLYLAWDFTVASTANTTGRLLSIRDRALASLDGGAPAFAVTSVQTDPAPGVVRRIQGTFEVPLYLSGDGSPGQGFANGADGLPRRNGTYTAGFDCDIPTSSVAQPARPVVYGHGLFGGRGEVHSGSQTAMVAGHGMAYCATDWIGMAEADIGNAATILQDLSTFNTLVDRSQQAIVNTTLLARLLQSQDGFTSHLAFQSGRGTPLLAPGPVFYDGNSQGGIIGGALVATAPDVKAGVLGVTGMNYSTLLERSVDFDPFFSIMVGTYPDPVNRVLGIGLIQMLWDRGETNGYAAHLTADPLPGSGGAKRVLAQVAVGDHQVATLTAEVLARTAGMGIHRPTYAPGRTFDVDPAWGLPAIQYPSAGSGLVIYDSGSPLAPVGNTPPRAGQDPHGDPRSDPDAQQQKDEFLRPGGTIVDVCAGAPCTADP